MLWFLIGVILMTLVLCNMDEPQARYQGLDAISYQAEE
jgi:hypothetical protein